MLPYSGGMGTSARDLIDTLSLAPHPEGGHYRRIHAASIEVEANGRRRLAMTAIHYLLDAGERSRWHRVDADECWHWQQGGVLELLYVVDFDHACANRNQLKITVREQ